MELVKVKESYYTECKNHGTDQELMFNEQGRPCVLIIQLLYKGEKQKFVVPLRSNISQTTPSNQFFPLPPNKNTKKGNHHGIHFIKLFPVTDKYIDKYLIDNNPYMIMIKKIIDNNEKVIVQKCKNYLLDIENGNKHCMTPDIDGIISWLS